MMFLALWLLSELCMRCLVLLSVFQLSEALYDLSVAESVDIAFTTREPFIATYLNSMEQYRVTKVSCHNLLNKGYP